jgi:hypothetical protein
MSVHRFHIAAIASWFVALAAYLAIRISLGVTIGAAEVVTMILMGCAPALVLITVFRGAPRTIGQLLYDTDHASSDLNRSDASDAC